MLGAKRSRPARTLITHRHNHTQLRPAWGGRSESIMETCTYCGGEFQQGYQGFLVYGAFVCASCCAQRCVEDGPEVVEEYEVPDAYEDVEPGELYDRLVGGEGPRAFCLAYAAEGADSIADAVELYLDEVPWTNKPTPDERRTIERKLESYIEGALEGAVPEGWVLVSADELAKLALGKDNCGRYNRWHRGDRRPVYARKLWGVRWMITVYEGDRDLVEAELARIGMTRELVGPRDCLCVELLYDATYGTMARIWDNYAGVTLSVPEALERLRSVPDDERSIDATWAALGYSHTYGPCPSCGNDDVEQDNEPWVRCGECGNTIKSDGIV